MHLQPMIDALASRCARQRSVRVAAMAFAVGALTAWSLPHDAWGEDSAAPGQLAPVIPAGTYALDRSHASLLFRVSHLGFSFYTARFTRFDAELDLDPADPAASSVTATIDASSIETDNPDPTYDFNAQLRDADWLDTASFAEMTFRSTAVEPTGPNTARVTGDLALHGVSRPVTLAVAFNGGYASHPLDPSGARIGFSAQGSLLRSEFGIAAGIPPPGSNIGVGDEVEILIEAEFTRPATSAP